GLGGGLLQRPRAARIAHLRPLPPLRVAEKDLRRVRTALTRLRDRVGLVHVGSDHCHGSSVSKPRRRADGCTCPPGSAPAEPPPAPRCPGRAGGPGRKCLGPTAAPDLLWQVHGKGGDPRVNSYRTREVTV